MYKEIGTLVILVNIVGLQCLGESCTQNSDCSTQNSMCLNNKCTCNKMSVESGSKCLQFVVKYKGYCQVGEQCEWLGKNSECTKNKCVCKKHFRWFRGQCRPYVNKGDKCSTQLDCYSGHDYLSLKCDDRKKICVCNEGYYDRGLDCRLISHQGSDCAIDRDCHDDNLTCLRAKCVLKGKSDQTITENMYVSKVVKQIGIIIKIRNVSIPCHFDDDCSRIGNSQCDVDKGFCTCLPETHFYQDNCLPGIGPCRQESDCTKKNSMCFKDSSCVCKQGYYLKNDECVPELGVKDPNLKSSKDCKIMPTTLENNICYCKNYWFNDDSNQNCIKTMAQQFSNCITSQSCDVIGPYSYCNLTTAKCECSKFSKLNKTTYICDKVSDQPKDSCLRDDECNVNEICYNNKCQCMEKFSRFSDGICLPNIGGSCMSSTCTHIEGAKCAGGTCVCFTNTSYVEHVRKCLKAADKLNDECEDISQCQHLKHAVCDIPERQNTTIKRCICHSDYVDIKMNCLRKKKYGDPCMTVKDCTLVLNDSFQCRKSMCQCPLHYKLKNGYCQHSGSSQLGSGQWTVYLVALITTLKVFLDG